MKIGEWQAKLVERFDWAGVELYLFQTTAHGREALNHEGELVTEKEGLSGTDSYFARFEDRDQLQALADAISNFGVKTPSDHKLEGVLEAQTKHLEDMRSLVFKTRRAA